MKNRRKFLKEALTVSSCALFPTIPKSAFSGFLGDLVDNKFNPVDFDPENESFWKNVAMEFPNPSNIINMNNGGVSPHPRIVGEAIERLNKTINGAPSYFMWRQFKRAIPNVKLKLAKYAGITPEEIAITRNASEALTNIIFGINLKKGDEVIVSNWDYPNMENAWKQRALREGIVLKVAQLDTIMENEEEIVERFSKLITPKTKAIYITHLINWTGQILPAKKLCTIAREKGILSIVDGAHSFGQLNFEIPDLNCDYFGTSLHKWISAPIGTGMLYVKKELIKDTWPLSGTPDPYSDEIDKFEHIGTTSFANVLAISHAVDFCNLIGKQRKEDRLRYLKDYWVSKVQDEINGFELFTSTKKEYSCAISTFSIKDKEIKDISFQLFHKSNIHTTSMIKNGESGIRISPNIYTSTDELDILVKSLKSM